MRCFYLLFILLPHSNVNAQETLETVTTHGAVTANIIRTGSFTAVPISSPSGSSIELSSPDNDIGIIFKRSIGGGSGGC